MIESTDSPNKYGPVRTLQIIVSAMALGTIAFLGVALLVRALGQEPVVRFERLGLLSAIAVGFGLMGWTASLVVPALMVRQGLAQKPPGGAPSGGVAAPELAGLYQTTRIVGAALCEGAAFFSLIAFQLEGSGLALAAAVGLTVAILAKIPTQARYDDWVARIQRDHRDAQQQRRLVR